MATFDIRGEVQSVARFPMEGVRLRSGSAVPTPPTPPTPDTTPPVVTFITTPGAQVNENDKITVQVTDDTGLFHSLAVYASFPNGSSEVVHDGLIFKPFYAQRSTKGTITDGFEFVIKQTLGWPYNPTIQVEAVDAGGNLTSGSATYELIVAEPTTTQQVIADPREVAAADPFDAFLGYGMITPFQRDKKRDFATAGGAELVKSAVRQVIGTRGASDTVQGEMPWRTEFGSLVHLLRHRNNDETTGELARIRVIDAIERWEPRVRVTNVEVEKRDGPIVGGSGTQLFARVQYDVIDRNVPGNNVILQNQEITVPV